MNKKYLLLFLLLNVCVVVHAQTKVILIKKLQNYEPVGDQTIVEPVTIIRKNQQDSIVLEFGKGGTQTDIYFRGPMEADSVQTAWREKYEVNLHDIAFGGGENPSPVINITGIPDGTYAATMTSCGFYGGIAIIIKTEK